VTSRGSTRDLKLKLCMYVQYGGMLIPRLSANKFISVRQRGAAVSSRNYAEDLSDEGTLLVYTVYLFD